MTLPLPPQRQKALRYLLQTLGLPKTVEVNWGLLDLALTHPSVSPQKNYQQLEFVGDAVIRLAAAEVLLETYPDAPVGEFSALRSIMVSDLADWADFYQLEKYLWATPQVLANQTGRISRLADIFEALLGALYLSSQSMVWVRPWLDEHLRQKAAEIRQDPARQNYKDALQEWTQGIYKCLPLYRVEEVIPHRLVDERFRATVWVGEQLLGEGTGNSKKAAEQTAARAAFYTFVQGSSPSKLL